ncbi:Tyrosine-protein phosphatase 4 [Folsomia candida]|uniref:Tyrosine-protein phosphatase 4 n=1 Tax=Folsomia candida TaxID=158441 RepID=A0A226ESC1_FOLCA|nr:Tyrosine-protein phosphatase 4 [Folsomia candida]
MICLLYLEISAPVEGVVGKRTDMTCDISSNRRDDSVYMVLWFRGDESIPIYSLDVRGKHFSAAKHWSADVPFGKRGHFQTTSEPARLIVEPVKVEDQGVYRCRVDFRNSPSRESRLNLTVIVPPQEPQIFEHTGMNVRGEVGPYREGSTIELTCIVRDGAAVVKSQQLVPPCARNAPYSPYMPYLPSTVLGIVVSRIHEASWNE